MTGASWLNAESLLHIGHCDEKVSRLNKQKLATPLTDRNPHFTAIIHACKATNPNPN